MEPKKRVIIKLKKKVQPKENKRQYKSRKSKELEAKGLMFIHLCQNIEHFQLWVKYCKEFLGVSPNRRFTDLMERDLKQYETEKLLEARGIVQYRDRVEKS